MHIRPFTLSDSDAVVELWRDCGLARPWNDPAKDIARKLSVQADWFLVGTLDDQIVATVMAGYDGHRGWINYLAIAHFSLRASDEPLCRKPRGFSKRLGAQRSTFKSVVIIWQRYSSMNALVSQKTMSSAMERD